jgi:hypothetical protein
MGGITMNDNKLGFFAQIYYAVSRPNKYYRLTRVSGGRLTGFVFLFIFIISLFTIIPVSFDLAGPNGLTQILKNNLPEFTLSDGELYVADRYEETEEGTYILVDTSIDQFSYDDLDQLRDRYDQVILVSRTNVFISQSYGKIQELDFANLIGVTIDNSIINVIIPFIYLILIIVAVIIYLFMVGGYFFSSLLYSLLGLIVSSISHADLSYARIFKTAVYGKVASAILFAMLRITPISMPGLLRNGISILLTCAFVVYGIISHTSEEAREQDNYTIPPQNFYPQ